MKILDGKATADQIKLEIAAEVEKMTAEGKKTASSGSNTRWR